MELELSRSRHRFSHPLQIAMITTIEEQKVQEIEKPPMSPEGSLDEKFSVDLNDGDEALRLIGAERTSQFSEEYNAKLRRKLVGICFPFSFLSRMLYSSTCLSAQIGLANSSAVCRCLFHPILVGGTGPWCCSVC